MKNLVYYYLLLTFTTYFTRISCQGVLPAESSLSLDPLVTLVSCLRDEKPGYCLQRRALSFFESWLTSQGDDDEESGDELNQSETGERLPAGLSPYWSKLVDSVAERISKMYGDEEDDDEPEDVEDVLLKDTNKVNKDMKVKSREGDSQVEARGKYKKDKKVKVAMTVILLIIYFIKSQLFYMFDKVARTAIFAKLVFAFKIFVIVKLLELKRYLWWVKEDKKEQWHHGVSVHDHVYEEVPPEHHYESPPWSGGWPWYSRSDHPHPHQMAYAKQTPIPPPTPHHAPPLH